MKNNQVRPSQIPHLVRLTADLFREMREETKSSNNNPINLRDESTQMHFVVDLLKDLVDTAYPIKENRDIENESIEKFDKALENIAEIAKEYVPPMPYENLQRLIKIINQGSEF